jgi:fructokinase
MESHPLVHKVINAAATPPKGTHTRFDESPTKGKGTMSDLYKDMHKDFDQEREFVYSHPLDEEPDANANEDDTSAAPWVGPPAAVTKKPKGKTRRYAGVEGGGTTWVCAIAEGNECDNIVARAEFPTTTPEETLAHVRAWLDARAAEKPFDALGVATFGPVDLDVASETYGYITHSPKPGWEKVNVLGALSDGSVPCGFDTDVNAPALSEFFTMKKDAALIDDDEGGGDYTGATNGGGGGNGKDWWWYEGGEGGAAASVTNLAYVTVGTGVGVGVVCNGQPVHGLTHPEAGHIRVARLKTDGLPGEPGSFKGSCPFHGDCVEGMASAAAIARRCGCQVSELSNVPDSHPAWDAAAHYIAGLCATLVMVASPQRIVLGGGVLQRKTLITKVRAHVKKQLGGYVQHDFITTKRGLVEFVVTSRHGNDAGIVGALTLAKTAHDAGAGAGRCTLTPPDP